MPQEYIIHMNILSTRIYYPQKYIIQRIYYKRLYQPQEILFTRTCYSQIVYKSRRFGSYKRGKQ